MHDSSLSGKIQQRNAQTIFKIPFSFMVPEMLSAMVVEFLKRDKIANKKKSPKRQSTDVTV
jgi:hypothetical protein